MRLSVWVVLVALLAAPAEAATYAAEVDLDALSAQAEAVVRGRVSRLESTAGGPGIVTEVTIRVEETLVGTPATEVRLVLPGGRLGSRTLTVPGTPQVAVGQEVVVFLDAEARLVGFGQGLLSVEDGVALRTSGHEVVEAISLPELRRAVR